MYTPPILDALDMLERALHWMQPRYHELRGGELHTAVEQVAEVLGVEAEDPDAYEVVREVTGRAFGLIAWAHEHAPRAAEVGRREQLDGVALDEVLDELGVDKAGAERERKPPQRRRRNDACGRR